MTCLSRTSVRRLATSLLGVAAVVLGGCSSTPWVANPPLMPGVKAALQPTPEVPVTAAVVAPTRAAVVPAQKEDALLALPAGRAERRFSVVLNNATPEVLFMALLAETPLSVAVDPSVKGPLSISLKDVTLREALDLLRELHGLEYKVIGRHILVSAAQLQTRIFTVDYPSFNRSGRSEVRVLSGSITGNASPSTPNSSQSIQNGSGGGGTSGAAESSRISTAQKNDLWGELESTVKLLIGEKEGRSVVVSPQTGNIVVRALPREIRAINDYLEATRVSVQRQVMLEAKVVEVQLRDSERTGINWAAFRFGLSTRASGGVVSPGGSLSPIGSGASIGDGLLTVNPGVALEAAATAAGSLLGLAFQTRNFAAVLDFLGTQGNTQVLSSPRIATMNNQKAVLKVGTDDFFVTSISSTTTAVGNTTATTPNIGVQPFFSGISLDVTPNIDAQGFITLHVHPSVSTVSERTKIINLGTQGSYALPLASSEINESDAVVRAHDGNIIAIGGLMRQASVNSDSGVPGTEGTGIFRKLLGGQTNRLSEKRELVILLKPTIVDPASEDVEARRDALQRLLDWTETQPMKPMRLGIPSAAVRKGVDNDVQTGAVSQASTGSPVALSWAAMAMSFGDSANASSGVATIPTPPPSSTTSAPVLTAQTATGLMLVATTRASGIKAAQRLPVIAVARSVVADKAFASRQQAAALAMASPAPLPLLPKAPLSPVHLPVGGNPAAMPQHEPIRTLFEPGFSQGWIKPVSLQRNGAMIRTAEPKTAWKSLLDRSSTLGLRLPPPHQGAPPWRIET